MRIGVDFDGVIIDTEQNFRYYVEKSMYERGQEPITRTNRDVFRNYQDIITDGIWLTFLNLWNTVTNQSGFIVGGKEILQKLRKEGHKLFLITARGAFENFNDILSAEKKLKEFDFKFDDVFFKVNNKAQFCVDSKIDVMIDDCNRHCKKLSAAGIKTLYFRDRNYEDLNHPNIVTVDNWFHIYKEIIKLDKAKNS